MLTNFFAGCWHLDGDEMRPELRCVVLLGEVPLVCCRTRGESFISLHQMEGSLLAFPKLRLYGVLGEVYSRSHGT